jgi:hypothetical protein
MECQGSGCQQDQAGDVAVELVGRQVWREDAPDEKPAEEREKG